MLWVIIQDCFMCDIAHIIPALAIIGSSFHLAYPSFYFSLVRCSSVIFGPSPRVGCFSKELWFLLSENYIKNWDLGARRAHCHWNVCARRPCRPTAWGSVFVYTHACIIHSYKYFYCWLSASILTQIRVPLVVSKSCVTTGIIFPLPLAYL